MAEDGLKVFRFDSEADLVTLCERVDEQGKPERKEKVLASLLVVFGAEQQSERLCGVFLDQALKQCEGDVDRLFAQDTLFKRGALFFLRGLLGVCFWKEACGDALDEIRTFDLNLDLSRSDRPVEAAGRLLEYSSRVLQGMLSATSSRAAATVLNTRRARTLSPVFCGKLLLAVVNGFLLQSPSRLLGAQLSLNAQRSCVAMAKALQSLSNALAPDFRPAVAAFGAKYFDQLVVLCDAGLRAAPPAPARLPKLGSAELAQQMGEADWAAVAPFVKSDFVSFREAGKAEAQLRTMCGTLRAEAAATVSKVYRSFTEEAQLLSWCVDECFSLDKDGLRARKGEAELPWAVLEGFVQQHTSSFLKMQLRDVMKRAADAEQLCGDIVDKLAAVFELLHPAVLALLGVARDRSPKRQHWTVLCFVVELVVVPAFANPAKLGSQLRPQLRVDLLSSVLPFFNVDFADETRLVFVRFCLERMETAMAAMNRIKCSTGQEQPLFYPVPLEWDEARRVLEEALGAVPLSPKPLPHQPPPPFQPPPLSSGRSKGELHPELSAILAVQKNVRPKTLALDVIRSENMFIEDLEELQPQSPPRGLLSRPAPPSSSPRPCSSPRAVESPRPGGSPRPSGSPRPFGSPRPTGSPRIESVVLGTSPRPGEDDQSSPFVLCGHCLCANPRNFVACRSCKKKASVVLPSSSSAALTSSTGGGGSPPIAAHSPVLARQSTLLRRSGVGGSERRKSVSELEESEE